MYFVEISLSKTWTDFLFVLGSKLKALKYHNGKLQNQGASFTNMD